MLLPLSLPFLFLKEFKTIEDCFAHYNVSDKIINGILAFFCLDEFNNNFFSLTPIINPLVQIPKVSRMLIFVILTSFLYDTYVLVDIAPNFGKVQLFVKVGLHSLRLYILLNKILILLRLFVFHRNRNIFYFQFEFFNRPLTQNKPVFICVWLHGLQWF